MKKVIYLLTLAMGTALVADAQKNTILVYGNAGINTSKDAGDNVENNFGFDLGVGYQFDKHWTVGLSGAFNTDRSRPDNADDWDFENSYRIAPFVRHTRAVNKIFAYWFQGEVGYRGGDMGNTGSNATTSMNGFYASVTPGVSVFFCKTWALNFNLGGIGFDSYKVEGVDDPNNSFGITFGRQVNAGISVNIATGGGKKFKRHRNSEADEDDGYDDWKRERRKRASDEDED